MILVVRCQTASIVELAIVSKHFKQMESNEPSRFRLCEKKGGRVRTILTPLSWLGLSVVLYECIVYENR